MSGILGAIFGTHGTDHEKNEEDSALFALEMFIFTTEVTALGSVIPANLITQDIIDIVETFLYVNEHWNYLISHIYRAHLEGTFFKLVEKLHKNSQFVNFYNSKKAELQT